MTAYFRRVQPAGGRLFTGGLAWLDLSGRERASSARIRPIGSLAGRTYFQRVVATRKPYVSAGLIGKATSSHLS